MDKYFLTFRIPSNLMAVPLSETSLTLSGQRLLGDLEQLRPEALLFFMFTVAIARAKVL